MKPLLTVLIITYNHQNCIRKCIKSVLNQKTNFDYIIRIVDDCSTDNTFDICKEFAQKFPQKIDYIRHENNIGIVDNIYNGLCSIDTEFFAEIEGDDYWCDENKLQIAIDTLKENTDCNMFGHNTNIISFQQAGDEEPEKIVQGNIDKKFSLCTDDRPPYLHFSSRVYRNVFDFKKIDKNIVAWDIGIYLLYLEKSNCYYDNRIMSVYTHQSVSSFFSKQSTYYQEFFVYQILKKINKMFEYKYSKCFSNYLTLNKKTRLQNLENQIGTEAAWEFLYVERDINHINERFIYVNDNKYCYKHIIVNLVSKLVGCGRIFKNSFCNSQRIINTELAIFDDVFPSKYSSFRYTEYGEYLKHFKSIFILCTGISLKILEKISIFKLLSNFLEEYPLYYNKIGYAPNCICKAKLIYVNFLGNTIQHDLGYSIKIPFIINLYPGGMLQINNKKIDAYLKKYLHSPYLRKVIVTQQNVYDYLIKNKFCSPEKIEFIFGVVTPKSLLNTTIQNKKRFNANKDTLDICFVAHKYTPNGEDKGYDTFIEVAHCLSEKYPNVKFHVVGTFDETIFDISKIKDKITFYGVKKTDWFRKFYNDKDIILSPNVPYKITPGSFDGFPTAAVTEAGLNEVAMFVSDELNLNQNHFIDKKELVIVKPNKNDIISKIDYYINHPKELESISKNGAIKIKQLYSFQKQIERRIDIIENELNMIKASENLTQKIKQIIIKNYNNNYTDTEYIPKFNEENTECEEMLNNKFLESLNLNFTKYEKFYNWLCDDESKNLLCQLLSFKLLGAKKIKLPLYQKNIWNSYNDLSNHIKEKRNLKSLIGNADVYDLSKFGFNLDILYSQFGIFLTFILRQYEYQELCKVEAGNYVIDGGAGFGDSALYFSYLAGENGKVFSFEPMKANLNIFNENLKLNPKLAKNIEIIKQPIMDKSNKVVRFVEDTAASHVSNLFFGKYSKYKTVSIDDFVFNNSIEKIDFIKLDIEGTEVSALKGAIKTIKKFKPKLAISIYHKKDDYETIPKLIKKINPNYKFYIKHNTVHSWETVLFAKVDNSDE